MTPIQKVAGIGQALAALLEAKGISTAEQLANTSPETLRGIPRLGAQRVPRLLAAAQKIVAGPENEAGVAAPAAPIASTEATSAIPDEAPAPQVTPGKKAGAKAASAKAAKKISAKAAKSASEKKVKAEKAPEKKVAKAAKGKAEKVSKAKPDKTAKPKKQKQSKKK